MAPQAPVKVEIDSKKDAIALEWTAVADKDNIPATGYLLYMDDGYNGEFSLKYDGSGLPFNTKFIATSLITGLPYRFKIKSKNINGVSLDSDESLYYACLRPESLPPPVETATTSTSISIEWQEPETNGCPITGFEIFRDTGNFDDLSISVDPSIVKDKPSLRQYMITGLTSPGNTYRFKIRVFNNAGYSDSYNVLNVVLADEP